MAKQLFITAATGSVRQIARCGNEAKLVGTATYWTAQTLEEVRGASSMATATVPTVTGATAGLEVQTGFNTPLEWLSSPLSADFTISGTITLNLWAFETANANNVAINAVIDKIDGATGVITQIAKTARTIEVATAAAVNNFTVTPTSTACKRGDRIRVRVFADDAGTMAAGGTASFTYSGTTAAANGDSWVQFTENLTLESEVADPTGSTYYLTDTAETINPGSAIEKKALTARGSGLVSAITNTVAGPTAGVQITDAAGGTAIEWYTPPLQAVSLGGRAKLVVRAKESAVGASALLRAEIAVTAGDGSGATAWAIGYPEGVPNTLSTTDAARTLWAAGDDTAIPAGGRIRFRVFIDDPGSNTGSLAAGFTATVTYNGPTAATAGDTYVILPIAVTEQVTGQTKAVTGLASPQSFGAPVAVVASSVSVGGVSSAQSFGVVTGIVGRPGGVSSAQSFGTVTASIVAPRYMTLLDDFNRADGAVSAGAGSGVWQPLSLSSGGPTPLVVSGNRLAAGAINVVGYTSLLLGPDPDLVIDCVVAPASGSNTVQFALSLSQADSSSFKGVAIAYDDTTSTWWGAYYDTGYPGWTMGGVPGVLPQAGETYWFSRRGNSVSLYKTPVGGGPYSKIGTWSFGGAVIPDGALGIQFSDVTQRWDNLRGGPVYGGTGGGVASAQNFGHVTATTTYTGYAAVVMADGPRGYWRLGESAAPFLDTSGNGTNFASGAVAGTVVYAQPSLLAGDATDKSVGLNQGYLSRGSAAALDVRDVFTIEAWIKLNQASGNYYMSIYSNWTGQQYFRISAANELQLVSSQTLLICTSTAAINDTNVHHVAVTKNGSTVHLYIDGVDVTGAVSNYTFTAVPSWMAIGSGSEGYENANMAMDEVALYATALSPARILAHYNFGTGAAGQQTVTVGGVSSAGVFGAVTIKTVAVKPAGGVGSSAAFGAPTIKTVIGLAAGGVASAQAFGTPTPKTAIAKPSGGVSSAQAFGTPTIKATATTLVSGLASPAVLGVPTIKTVVTRSVGSVSSAQVFGVPTVKTVVTKPSGGVSSAASFGTLTIKTVRTIAVPAVSSAAAFGTPALLLQGVTGGVTSAAAFGIPKSKIAFTVAGVSSAAAYGTPVVLRLASVSVSGVGSAQAFGVPVAGKAVDLVVSVPGVNEYLIVGQFLVGQRLISSHFGSVTVLSGPVTVGVGGVASAQNFGSVTAKATVSRPVFGVGSPQAFGVVKIVFTRQAGGVPSAAAFGVPRASLLIPVTGVPTAQRFGVFTVKTGPVFIPVHGLASEAQFGLTIAFIVYLRPPVCVDLPATPSDTTTITLTPAVASDLALQIAGSTTVTLEPADAGSVDLDPSRCN